MTTVNTSSETVYVDNNYTWATSDFYWTEESIFWDLVGIVQHNCDVSEPISLSDSSFSNVNKVSLDTLYFSDSVRGSLTHKISDVFLLSDVAKQTVSYNRQFSDSFLLSDNYSSVTNFARTFSDSILLSESLRKSFTQKLSDSLYFGDLLLGSFTQKISDNFLLSNTLLNSFSQKNSDSILFSDAHKKSFTRKELVDMLLSDTVKNVTTFNRYFVEDAFSFGDAYSVVFTKKNYDDLIFSDSYKVNFGLKSSINVSLSDAVKTNLTKKIADSFLLSDTYKPTFTKKLYDDLLLSDSYRTQFVNKFPELFNFVDVIDNLCDFRRVYYDDFSLNNTLLCEVGGFYGEELSLSEVFMRGFDFSISNLGIKTSDLTIDSFLSSLNTPFGYSPFQELVVGEYDYKDAIIRTSITTQNSAYITAINKLNIHVDIPDTDDRGVVNIPAQNTFVSFNKTYYTTPEVNVNIKGGTAGQIMIPHITGGDNTGFYIELRDLNNNLVAGQISWTSKGY